MGCCSSKPDEQSQSQSQAHRANEMLSARDASIRVIDEREGARPLETRGSSKGKGKKSKDEKRLTVRLYKDAVAEREMETARYEDEDALERARRDTLDDQAFIDSKDAKAAKRQAEAARELAKSERVRNETWSVLGELVDAESTKRHTLVVRERSTYAPGANNDVDLPTALDALCVMSLCLQRDPIPFDTLTTAHAQLAKELRKLNTDNKRLYFDGAVVRNRYGLAAVQSGKQTLADAARTAFERTERLAERITKVEQQALRTLSSSAFALMTEPEQRSAKLQVRQPLLQAVQMHWDDMRTVLDALHPPTPLTRLSQLRDTLQQLLDEALQAALLIVRDTCEPCEPAELERVSDAVTTALFNMVGVASLLTRNAIGIGDLTRLRGQSDTLWLLVKGARMLALLSIDLATGSDDGIEQQRLARSLKQFVHGMTRRLDTVLDACAGEGEPMSFYTIDKPLRDYCETELRAAAAELEQARELFVVQTQASPNAALADAIAAVASRVSAYDALLVSVAPADLVKHTRRLGGEIERALSRLALIALRAVDLPLYKDALVECLQATTHHALQLRVLGGARALDYNVVIYHGALVLLCRQLCGALAAALQICTALASLGATNALVSSPDDLDVLPQISAYLVQQMGPDLGRTKTASDVVSSAVRSNLDVDGLLLDVARSAKDEELRKLDEERRQAAARRELELQRQQAALLEELDDTAAVVDQSTPELGPEPPKPVGFDENQPYSQEVHGDYREWAKQKYAYAEWLRHRDLAKSHKQQLATARASTSRPVARASTSRPAVVYDDDDEAPPAPPAQDLAKNASLKRASLRIVDADPEPPKPTPLKPGASTDEYKAFMKAKYYREQWENKQAVKLRQSQR
jgi:hypothetical protein